MARERTPYNPQWTDFQGPAHPAFDAWLRGGLAEQYRGTLSEAVPDLLLALLAETDRLPER
jgi:hypothetical protein